MLMERDSLVARYTSGAGNHYFDWDDAASDTARSLADKFLQRFDSLTQCGRGWDYPYGGWYERLLGYAESGWIPCLCAARGELVKDNIHHIVMGLDIPLSVLYSRDARLQYCVPSDRFYTPDL